MKRRKIPDHVIINGVKMTMQHYGVVNSWKALIWRVRNYGWDEGVRKYGIMRKQNRGNPLYEPYSGSPDGHKNSVI